MGLAIANRLAQQHGGRPGQAPVSRLLPEGMTPNNQAALIAEAWHSNCYTGGEH